MNPSLKHILTILVICGATLFWNLGSAKLWDRDEPRNAGCAAEMLAANNWAIPIFNDELRHQKPVLLYWLMMSAYSVFGQNEFAARFWSALLGTGSCLLTYAIGRRMFDASVGWLAAIILATNVMFCVAARAATPDSVLIFCCTVAYWFYVRAVFRNGEVIDGAFPKKAIQWVPFYLALGLAVLAKGPIGYLIPMAVVGLFMLIERNSNQPDGSGAKCRRHWIGCFSPVHFLKTLWSMKFLVGTVFALFVAFPWYDAVDTQTRGLFTRLFFLNENFARASTAMEGHSGGLWFYPLAILAGFFPWSVFVGPTIASWWSRSSSSAAQRSAVTFLICWVAVQVTTFSLCSTKLPSYVTPCYSALALLTSFSLVTFVRSEQRFSAQRYWYMAAMIALLISGVGMVIGFWLGAQKYLPNLTWLALLGLIPVVGATCGLWLLRRPGKSHFVGVAVVCGAVLCWLAFGIGTVVVSDQRQTDAIFERIAQYPCEAVGAWQCMEPSWVVYGERPIYELEKLSSFDYPSPASIGDDVRYLRSKKSWELKSRPVVSTFLLAFPDALMITTDEHLDSLTSELPARYKVLEQVDRFLKPDQSLILLGPVEPLTE